jgi:hypothetical protein
MFNKIASWVLILCKVAFALPIALSLIWIFEQINGATSRISQYKHYPVPTLDTGAALLYTIIFVACIIAALYVDEYVDNWVSKRELRKSSK